MKEGLPPNYGYLERQFSARMSDVKNTLHPGVTPVDKGLPPTGKKVIVVCRECRLLGYLDEKGVWREERRPAEELQDVVGWYEVGVGK